MKEGSSEFSVGRVRVNLPVEVDTLPIFLRSDCWIVRYEGMKSFFILDSYTPV